MTGLFKSVNYTDGEGGGGGEGQSRDLPSFVRRPEAGSWYTANASETSQSDETIDQNLQEKH